MDETPQIDDELVTKPAATDVASSPSKGRLADRVAAIIAASALGLSLLLSALFFAGFVANDYHIFAITSALGLSLFLGGFAIIPMAIIMILALKAHRQGGNVGLYLWAVYNFCDYLWTSEGVDVESICAWDFFWVRRQGLLQSCVGARVKTFDPSFHWPAVSCPLCSYIGLLV